MDDERITEAREEVADMIERDPETPDEAAEQRTDDYDGIVRRLDDLAESVRVGFEDMRRALDAIGVSAVEGDMPEIVEDMQDSIDELVGLDALDLL